MKVITKATALTIAGSLGLSLASAANATPKVYGKANISYQYNDSDAGDGVWELQSNASRVGIKGELDLIDGLTGIYKAEYEVNFTDGGSSNSTKLFKSRNTYAGVKGSWGKVFFGIHDTPVKKAQGKVDLFNDYKLGDIKGVVEGENRINNTLSYQSPKFAGGFKGWIMLVPGEQAGTDEDGPADGISASITYKDGPIYAALAIDSDVDNRDLVRGAIQYKAKQFMVGAIVQSSEDADGAGDRETGFVVSGGYKFGRNLVKAQYSSSDESTQGANMVSVGLDHKLTKKSKIYGFYSVYDTDAANSEQSSIGVGIEHKF